MNNFCLRFCKEMTLKSFTKFVYNLLFAFVHQEKFPLPPSIQTYIFFTAPPSPVAFVSNKR